MFSLFSAQVPVAASQTAQSPAAVGQGVPGSKAHSIVVPVGTAIPLTLVNQIKSKSTKVGDSVRAVVAFPVTSGVELAIPAGTYVDGMVTGLKTRVPQTGQPDVQIHFTRLLYANGYSVDLDAKNTMAMTIVPESNAPAEYTATDRTPGRVPAMGSSGFMAAQTTQPPTVSMPGPNPVEIVVPVVGGFFALLAGMLVAGHHRAANTDYLLFDAGWQFQMILQSPLTVDSAQVAAAASAPSTK